MSLKSAAPQATVPATAVTLSALVAMDGLHLVVLAGEQQLDRPVRWVHTLSLIHI